MGALILEDGICTSYPGGYTAAKEEQERQMLLEFEQYKNQQKQIEAMKAAIKRFREWGAQADNPKFFRRAKMLELRLEKMEMIKRPQLEKPKIPMRFAGDRTGREVLKLTGFSLSFGKTALFEQAELLVEEKDRMAFLGANGTGKTTTINILSGYLEPQAGECRIFGENIRTMSPLTRRRIGLLIEGHVQYQFMTIRQIERFYAAFYPAWNRDAYYALMEKLQVAPGQRIARMSCGQRSQVALGLILAQNADLLVLDDFSMGLDPGYRRLFVDYLRDFARAEGKTVFLTSHIIQDMERLIDDCIIMDYGRILVQMPVDELLRTFRRYTFRCADDAVLPSETIFS